MSTEFWTSSKTQNRFGATSIAALTFIVMNISSNIFTSEGIMFYLPWFAAPMISAIVADWVFNKKWESKIMQKHSGKIAGFADARWPTGHSLHRWASPLYEITEV